MKVIILIISVIISVLGLIAGQFLYPLIASWSDGSPTYIALFVGVISFIIITILTLVLTKDKFIRMSILIPVFVSILATVGSLVSNFEGSFYNNGYCWHEGYLKNQLGINFFDIRCSRYLYRGINEYGEEVFVNALYSDDWEYRNDHDGEEEKYDYTIRVFNEFGNLIDETSFTLYYDKGDDILHFEEHIYPETKQIIEECTGVKIYQEIG